jgi:hypothetical protein
MENSSKTIVRRYLEEVVSTGNLERVSDFVAPADVEAAIDHIRAIRDLPRSPSHHKDADR